MILFSRDVLEGKDEKFKIAWPKKAQRINQVSQKKENKRKQMKTIETYLLPDIFTTHVVFWSVCVCVCILQKQARDYALRYTAAEAAPAIKSARFQQRPG